jgi:hypothetical protein
VKAGASGAISANITIPQTSNGNHRIHAVGQGSKKRTAVTFKVGAVSTATPTPTGGSNTLKPALTLSKSSGPAGTKVQISGENYGASETVRVYLNSTKNPALASVTANSSGELTAEITIPDTVGGNHRIHVVGSTSKLRTAKTFVLTPTIMASKTTGVARETITILVKGFAANETIGLFWNGSSSAEATVETDADGTASFTGKAPWPNGAHTGVIRGETSGLEGSVTFTVRAKIKLTPSSGDGTTTIGVRGTGFPASTTVNVFWGSSSSGNLLCSARTSAANGTFDCEVSPKPGASAGTISIIAIGGGKSASASFTLTSAVAAQAGEPETEEPTSGAAEATEIPKTPENEATETPVSTEVPTEAPTEVPTETPTPEPVPREIALLPVADTSVSAAAPDQPQPEESIGGLPAGGENGNVAFITFQVEGIAAGSVVDATLVLTGSGATSGPAGTVRVVNGYYVDEANLTYAAAPTVDLPPAVRADGGATTVDWVDPGVELYVDVTGTVSTDGTITFAIAGLAESGVVFGSRESATPPRLVITVLEAPPAQ